jgi:hypothetical protein
MLELSPARKNKVNLADYPCQQDIENRILMSDFSTLDVQVLEAILYSPLKISQKKLARSLECEEKELLVSLKKLSSTGFLSLQDDAILVDKEKRKYFESQIHRFDPDFKPDMEFLQSILRKVPIHLLPTWYSIPRTSNNIFESIVEKYLLTPHIYQRYLQELNLGDPTLNGIIQDLFQSPDFKISSTDLIAKYNLKRRDFEEMMLILEFNFVCCVCYEKEEDHWVEVVTPFHEWREYLRFLKRTEAPTFELETDQDDFAFLKQTPSELSLEDRALYLYRHAPFANERYVREAEKSVKRVLHGKWVFFDDFVKGVIVPLNEQSVVCLKKFGKHWKYTLPTYGEQEIALLKTTIFEWLWQLGMVKKAKVDGRDCFALTHFGRFFFDD